LRYYLATKLENNEQHNRVRDAVGGELTYDWTAHGPVWSHGSVRMKDVACHEVKGVADANLLAVILPGGRGTHVELGVALGCGIPVIMLGGEKDYVPAPGVTTFHWHPLIEQVWEEGHFIERIRQFLGIGCI
jgi:hypothetical protein